MSSETKIPEPSVNTNSTLLATRRALFSGFALLLAIRWVMYAQLASGATEPYLVDFDTFYIVSQLVQDGSVEEAYSFRSMLEAQARYGLAHGFMPWTYPPPYNLLIAPLAHAPNWLAHLIFAGSTLAAYLAVLRRLSGEAFTPVLLAIFPASGMNILLGQNGSLTGAITGLAVLLLMRKGSAGGAALGLMVIKPHLAIGLGLYIVVARRWGAVLLAAGFALLACAAATLAFGPGVWMAFFEGVKESGQFLQADFYHLHRMSSVYASARSMHLPINAAVVVQAIAAILAIGAIIASARSALEPRYQMGIAVAAALFITPYSYGYDIPVFGVAAALFAPALMCRASSWEKLLLLLLSWTACLWGAVAPALVGTGSGGNAAPSGSAVALVALVVVGWHILRRSNLPRED